MVRILVVEDSATMRSFVRDALESGSLLSQAGTTDGSAEVVVAASGFEALRLLPRGPWDLIVSDVNVPDVNGLELLRFIRKSAQHREVPVLLMSSLTSERERERGMSLGASAWLKKPFTAEALREAANLHLAARATGVAYGGEG